MVACVEQWTYSKLRVGGEFTLEQTTSSVFTWWMSSPTEIIAIKPGCASQTAAGWSSSTAAVLTGWHTADRPLPLRERPLTAFKLQPPPLCETSSHLPSPVFKAPAQKSVTFALQSLLSPLMKEKRSPKKSPPHTDTPTFWTLRCVGRGGVVGEEEAGGGLKKGERPALSHSNLTCTKMDDD